MSTQDTPADGDEAADGGSQTTAAGHSDGPACGGNTDEAPVRDRDLPAPSDDFKALYRRLRPVERKYIRAYADLGRKDKAAEAVGMAPSTVYKWEEEIHEAANHLNDKAVQTIEAGRDAQSTLAVEVMRSILEDEDVDDRVRFEAAKYIQDQQTGKPTRKSEVEVDGGLTLDADDEDAIDDALSHLD